MDEPILESQTQTVGWYLLNRLQELGVDHIFGIPGDYVIRFDKQIELHPIRFINATREDTAGYMADGYSRLKGIGAACITYGVGINIVNAIAQAYVEESSIVIISGAASLGETKKNPLLHHLMNKSPTIYRDKTQLEIFKQITVAQIVLENPRCAVKQIEDALHKCLIKKQPVYIEIPRDIVEAPIPNLQRIINPCPESDTDALAEALDEVEEILRQSQKPFIWVGKDILSYQLTDFLLRFAEEKNIPITSTLLGKTAVSEKHPLFLGVYQGALSKQEVSNFVEQCDCALMFGIIMNDVNTGFFTTKLDNAKQILATPQGITVGHHTYSKILFSDFIKGLGHIQLDQPYTHFQPFEKKKKNFIAARQKKITTGRLFECLNAHLTHEHIIIPDIGDALFASSDLSLEHNSYVASAYFAALGSGIPMALGAQFAAPERRAVAVIGDGACQMSALELTTAIRYHLDPVVIILNNHGYGTERPLLEGEFNDLHDWEYTLIPSVLGAGVGIKVYTEEECDAALATAFNTRGRLFLIEIELDKLDFSPVLCRFKDLAKKTV